MSWLCGNDVVHKIGENAFLYDLSKIRDVSAIISRIPNNMSGVYAWYRNFKIDASAIDNPDVFVASIFEELDRSHCVTRETRLPPSHRFIVKPETILSQKKQEALKYYANDPDFREFLMTLLNNCLLFQQPLYIGKAVNLRTRISNHLSVDSVLRERLKEAEHNLEQCRLLILGCSESVEVEDTNKSEFPQLESEALIEDILSRLFLPSFTINGSSDFIMLN